MGQRFHALLKRHLEDRGYSFYWLQEHLDLSSSLTTLWKRPLSKGGRRPSEYDIQLLASCKELELTEDMLLGWRATDEYTQAQLREALKSFGEPNSISG